MLKKNRLQSSPGRKSSATVLTFAGLHRTARTERLYKRLARPRQRHSLVFSLNLFRVN